VKGLLVASIVALVVVGGLGLYSLKVIGEAARRAEELDKVRDDRAKELRETNALFPYAPLPRLDPARFQTWLEARIDIARALAERAAQPSSNTLHAKETINEMLAVIRGEIVERRMSLAEYRATSARWRALLGLPEFAELSAAFSRRTATEGQPTGIPLPPPVADAQEKELEQIRRYARLLEESMDADLMDPLLEKIG
jgi:tRNA A37 N6-isopentenylltransferase MiaA